MNRTINFYLKILLSFASFYAVPLQGMKTSAPIPQAVTAAAAVGIINGQNKAAIKLAIEKVYKAECAECKATENIKQYHGCAHYFCKACKKKQVDNSCALCSGRKKQCSICLEPLICNNREVRTLVCKHEYHRECISEWERKSWNKTCPLCVEPIKYKTEIDCEFCFKRLFSDVEIDGPICEVKQWSFEYIIPLKLTKQIKHCIHDTCLNEFIMKDILIEEGGKKYLRTDGKGKLHYRCMVHDTIHELTNPQLEKYGLKPVEPDPDKLVAKKKKEPKKIEPKKVEKTPSQIADELCFGIVRN